MTLESHRKIELTLATIFRYNSLAGKYEGENIELRQVLDELNDYLNYVKKLKPKYNIKKEHSLEDIAKEIFSKIKNKDRMNHIKHHFNCHIEAFEISLKDVQRDLELICNNEDNCNVKVGDNLLGRYIKGRLALLRDLIFDFNEIYWQIEEYIYDRPQKMKSSVRRMIMGREILDSSICILKREVLYSGISYSPVSIFLLRQSIEISMLRALGIYSFVDKEGIELKYSLNQIYKFLKKNKKYIKIPVEISLLDKIVQWTNLYVHKAITKYCWQIIVAQKVLIPLHTMSKDDKNMSIYGIQINKNFYYNDLEPKIKECLKLKDAQVIRFENPECLLTDNVFE